MSSGLLAIAFFQRKSRSRDCDWVSLQAVELFVIIVWLIASPFPLFFFLMVLLGILELRYWQAQ